jgi:ABC-type branched-subunit amino acid transport system substrate-binding protein
MTDLRRLPRLLADQGAIDTPPMEAVARRARAIRARRAGTTLIAAVLLVVLAPSVVQWITDGDESSHVRLVDRTGEETDQALAVTLPPAVEDTAALPTTGTALPSPSPTTTSPQALECRAGANGGATDIGVTETSIRIAMTETLEFPTRYATATAYANVRSLFDYVNLHGGICGRRIDFRYANDAWRPLPWDADADMVAGIAGPFDPAVDERISDGEVDRAGTPLVGVDGVTAAQHLSPWVWPLGTSMTSITRIAVDHAYRVRGARTFALVYDSAQRASRQAAAAFRDYVGRLPDATVVRIQNLDAGTRNYSREALDFALACRLQKCDHVLLALTPGTAVKWLKAPPVDGAGMQTAMLPLQLTSAFWEECPRDLKVVSACKDLHVWTADPEPAISVTCPDVNIDPMFQAVKTSACILVEALRQTGPYLTRARLRAAIDDLSYRAGMVATFDGRRRVPDDRAGVGAARALRPVYSLNGDFKRVEQATGRIRDPLPGWFPEESSAQ